MRRSTSLTFSPVAFSPVAGLLLGLSLACGGMGSGSSDISYRSEPYEVPPGAEGYPELDRAYRVPPDRALVAVHVRVEQPTAPAASAELTREVGAVVAAVGTTCAATPLDYSAPSAAGSDAWSATAEVRLDVDLRGLPTVDERRARIDACLAGVEPLLTRQDGKKTSGGARQVMRSAAVLSVDDPEQHRDALLDRARARLTWAASATGAPQLQPGDLRCVPDGTVHMTDRRLSGVVLSLGMPCRIGEAAPVVGASD